MDSSVSAASTSSVGGDSQSTPRPNRTANPLDTNVATTPQGEDKNSSPHTTTTSPSRFIEQLDEEEEPTAAAHKEETR
jgi:hypothetical protein